MTTVSDQERAGPSEATSRRLVRLVSESRPAPLLDRCEVVANGPISSNNWLLTLRSAEISERAQPGQFVMLTLAREHEVLPVLPRPMALFGWNAAEQTILIGYKVVGRGTEVLTAWAPGEVMTVVGPLGQGWRLSEGATRIVLIGRGIGSCSLTSLARYAQKLAMSVIAVDSAGDQEHLFGTRLYRALGLETTISVTDSDGSSQPEAVRGAIDRVIAGRSVDQIFVCGSNRLAALALDVGAEHGAEVQVSIEAHMACGLGYCHGCASSTSAAGEEAPLVCLVGPAFGLERERG